MKPHFKAKDLLQKVAEKATEKCKGSKMGVSLMKKGK